MHKNIFAPRVGYLATRLLIGNIFSLYVKKQSRFSAPFPPQKTDWLKFKFENLDVLCDGVNRNNFVPILANR